MRFLRLLAERFGIRKYSLFLPGPGAFAVEVVGESRFQRSLERAAGGRKKQNCKKVVDANLVVRTHGNSKAKTVCVYVNGRPCGVLPSETARSYRRQLKAAGYPDRTALCKARIVGGWDRGPNDRGYFGIYLDLPEE